jgi:hypothetical protein
VLPAVFRAVTEEEVEEGDEPLSSLLSHWWRFEEEKSSLSRRSCDVVVVVDVVVGCHSGALAAPANSSSSAGRIQRPPGQVAGVGRSA